MLANAASDIANTFGLQWSYFLAQVIIFLIVFAILKWKAFGPIQAMLEQRRQRIAEGEENLKKIQEDMERAEAKAQEITDKANEEADRLIEEARESANVLAEKKAEEATSEANQIIAKAREATELEKEQAMSELKRDFGRLVINTTSKVTGKILDDEDQERINQETAGQIAQ